MVTTSTGALLLSVGRHKLLALDTVSILPSPSLGTATSTGDDGGAVTADGDDVQVWCCVWEPDDALRCEARGGRTQIRARLWFRTRLLLRRVGIDTDLCNEVEDEESSDVFAASFSDTDVTSLRLEWYGFSEEAV